MLAGTLDPLITIDAHGTVQFASDSCERVLGWKPDDLVGRNVSVLMPEPHRSAHDGYLAAYRRTGFTNILGRPRELECVRVDGERIPIELSVSRVDPPGGRLPLFVGIIRDISKPKRLERELRLLKNVAVATSEARDLRSALMATLREIGESTRWEHGEAWSPNDGTGELAGVVTWTRSDVNLDGFVAAMSDPGTETKQRFVGRCLAEGRPLWFGDLAEDPAFSKSELVKRLGLRAACAVPVIESNRSVAVLLFFTREHRHEDLHLLELATAAVVPLGAFLHRQQTNDQLAESRRQLEELVQQRTADLERSRDQLRMADRLAAIGTLAAGLGHDMNNVLLPVRAHINALRQSHTDEKVVLGHVNEIGDSIGYLQQLADGLHYLAMDPDTIDQDQGPTDLRQWWAQVGVLLTKAVPKHVQVTAEFADDCPPVAVALHRLTQAVLNLVVNAGEAIAPLEPGQEPAGRINLSARPAGTFVRLSVTDNGCGMTEDVQHRAFEMFFTTKTRGLGTGLGLALVHRVAHDVGGSVGVRSRPGEGTTVELLLPTAEGRKHGKRLRAAIDLPLGRSRSLVAQLLESAGAELTKSRSPGEADIWVAPAATIDAETLRSWRARQPDARLVLLGRRGSTSGEALRPVAMAGEDDFEALRAAVITAMH